MDVFGRDNVDAGPGDVGQQHVADMDGRRGRHALERRDDLEDLALRDILRRLAADDARAGAAAGQPYRTAVDAFFVRKMEK